MNTRKKFLINSCNAVGIWESNDIRYRRIAHEQLEELITVVDIIKSVWPKECDSIIDKKEYPEIWKLSAKRDMLSDNARIYSAMATEGFINFYGVLRLGQSVFNEHFERLSTVNKLKSLFLICDQIQINDKDPIIFAIKTIAESRNELLHPKAKELVDDSKRTSTPIPDYAMKVVSSMESFFSEFNEIVPAMELHIKLA